MSVTCSPNTAAALPRDTTTGRQTGADIQEVGVAAPRRVQQRAAFIRSRRPLTQRHLRRRAHACTGTQARWRGRPPPAMSQQGCGVQQAAARSTGGKRHAATSCMQCSKTQAHKTESRGTKGLASTDTANTLHRSPPATAAAADECSGLSSASERHKREAVKREAANQHTWHLE